MARRLEWIDIDSAEGKRLWLYNDSVGRVILLWKEDDRPKVGIGSFHGGSWTIDRKHYRFREGPVQPTHFMPLPPRPDGYEEWEY